MNAVATAKSKRRKAQANGNGKHQTPDETGTTTPAGIAANDPDVKSWYGDWLKLRPRVNDLTTLVGVEPADHQEAAFLLTSPPTDKTFRSHLARARRLVEQYFPGETE